MANRISTAYLTCLSCVGEVSHVPLMFIAYPVQTVKDAAGRHLDGMLQWKLPSKVEATGNR